MYQLRTIETDYIWSYGYLMASTADGKVLRLLNIIDKNTRECLAIEVKRKIASQDVIDQLFELFIFRGIPEHIISDNGPEFTTKAIHK